MHVCMISHSFYESDTRILQYADALVARGDSVDVIALRAPGTPRFELMRRVRVFRVLRRKGSERTPLQYLLHILQFLLLAGWAVARHHADRRYDVVHVHSVPDFLVFAAIFPKLMGARVVLDIHDIFPEFYASKFGVPAQSLLFRALVRCEQICAGFADHVIIANELWRERLIGRSVDAQKCTAIGNYPDPRIFYPRSRRKADGKFRILYPGTLNSHQGVDIALLAFAQIAVAIPQAEFRIHGQGPQKNELLELRKSLRLQHRVVIEDFLPVDRIATVMAEADLAVVPKRATSIFGNEAASTKIMEFMSVGVPVIASRTRIDSLYFDESQVCFVESENPEALAAAILRLWGSPELRQSFREAGLRYVQEHSWARTKHIYFQLLDRPHLPVNRCAEDQAHA